ncbi:unnamed protein product [Lactuca saligna]|uniref:Uncharacterized protein n=1 Tax=Lactuca saligna TaxID=75948 RepID=A0AA35VPC0_LACSI|nr:unnamed protein product [Lactuca saligna]
MPAHHVDLPFVFIAPKRVRTTSHIKIAQKVFFITYPERPNNTPSKLGIHSSPPSPPFDLPPFTTAFSHTYDLSIAANSSIGRWSRSTPPFHAAIVPAIGSSGIPAPLYPSVFGCSWLFFYVALLSHVSAHQCSTPSDKAHGGSTERPDKRIKTTDASNERPDKRSKTTNASIERPDKRAKTSDASTDRTDRTDMDKASKTSVSLDKLSLDMQKALQHMVNSKEGPTVEEFYERLKLVELDPMDPIFLAAFHLFGMSMNMREAWMTLPPIPGVLKGWIKMTGTTLGMFK